MYPVYLKFLGSVHKALKSLREDSFSIMPGDETITQGRRTDAQ